MDCDACTLWMGLRSPEDLDRLIAAGVTEDLLLGRYGRAWRWILDYRAEHGELPGLDITWEEAGGEIAIRPPEAGEEVAPGYLVARLRERAIHRALKHGLTECAEALEEDRQDDCGRRILRLADEYRAIREPLQPAHPSTARTAYPVHVLPPALREYVARGAAACSVPPEMIGLPLLVGLAACVGLTRCLQLRQGWDVYPILWAAIIARSGARKTPASKYGLGPATRVHEQLMARLAHEREAYEVGQMSRDEGVDRPEKPREVRLIVSDITMEALHARLADNRRGILVYRDELGAWLAGHGQYKRGAGRDTQAWMELHSAGPLSIERKADPPIWLPRAGVSIFGTVQPGELAKIADEHGEKGLVGRFLFAAPVVGEARWDPGVDDTGPDLVDLAEALYGLAGGAEGRVVLPLDRAAQSIWAAWYAEAQRRTMDAPSDLTASAAAKVEEAAARLALVLALAADPEARSVGAEAMAAGVELARWHAAEAARVLRTVETEDPAERRRSGLLAWLGRRAEGATARDIARGAGGAYRGRGGSALAEDDLRALARSGAVEAVHAGPSEAGGRPTDRWVVTTSVADAEPMAWPEPISASDNDLRY